MNARHTADHLIAELGRSLGIPALTFDARGCCTLVFDRVVAVNIALDVDFEGLLLMSHIGKAASHAPLKSLLVGNYLWRETAGATLSLDPSEQSAVLTQRLPLSQADYSYFNAQLNLFVTTTEKWQKRLADASEAQPLPAYRHLPMGGVAV